MKKKIKTMVTVIMLSLSVVACSSGVSSGDYRNIVAEKESLAAELESVSKEYSDYKESMSEYEGLAAAEARAREIEAESIAESKAKEEEESIATEQAEQEAREKAGYDTGISYIQLARNPDNYKGQKVKFEGEVLQVMEVGKENQIRLAVHKNQYGEYGPDEVLYCGYDPSIISYRLLERDIITIYGTANGLFSYEAVSGATITLPAVWIDKIELE